MMFKSVFASKPTLALAAILALGSLSLATDAFAAHGGGGGGGGHGGGGGGGFHGGGGGGVFARGGGGGGNLGGDVVLRPPPPRGLPPAPARVGVAVGGAAGVSAPPTAWWG